MATNRINEKKYIGQTIRPWPERKNEHHHPSEKGLLTRAILKHGKDSFEWTILEDDIKTESELDKREKYWIEFHESFDKEKGYNIDGGGQKSHLCKRPLSIYCHQNGKMYSTSTEAARDLRLDPETVRTSINHKHRCAGGYTFEKLDGNKTYPLPLLPMKDYHKPIPIYCHQTQQIYPSAMQAAKTLKTNWSSIRAQINGTRQHIKGYTFEEVKDESKYPLPLRDFIRSRQGRTTPIICLTNGKEYWSISEASKELDVNFDGITAILKGRKDNVKGYKFIYKNQFKEAS